MELSPFGHEQAHALADYLQRIPFDVIYASPMKRVQQTLAELIENQNRRPIILNDLREVDFGVWTGLSWEQVKEQFNTSAFEWLDQLERGLISEAELIGHFRDRVDGAIRKIVEECSGQTVAVVCHGGVIRMILAILMELPLTKMAGFDIEYASLTIVDYLPGKTEVQLLNYTPWRDKA